MDPATDGTWYLHLFTPEQPDELGAPRRPPGTRGDPQVLVRARRGGRPRRAWPPCSPRTQPADFVEGRDPHPYVDRDELHDIYRSWRTIAYDRIFVGEVWLPDTERFARYLRPDELHTAFNFSFLSCPWDAGRLRTSIDETLAERARVARPPPGCCATTT